MPQNTWTGSILELDDPKSTYEESEVDNELAFSLEEYFFNHLAGISVVEGGGTLPPIWDEVEEEMISGGYIGVTEYLSQKFLATVTIPVDVMGASNALRQFDTVDLTLLSNKRVVLRSTKGEAKDVKTGQIVKDDRGYPYPFVVFQNNRDCVGYLGRIRYFIKNMILCVKKHRRDIFMSEKRLIVFAKEQLDDDDMDYFLEGWRKKEAAQLTVQKSRRPGKEARAEGKEGVSPHDLNFQVYEPKTDERAKLIRDFWFWMGLAEKLVGVRSDPLKDKADRANNPEVLASQASFDAFEKKGAKWRVKGIREYIRVFNEPDANLTLKYGSVERKI
jgi:hypothetical protein